MKQLDKKRYLQKKPKIKIVKVSLDMPQDLKKILVALARELNQPVGALIRDCISYTLEQWRKAEK